MPLTKKEMDKLLGEVNTLLKAADPSADDSSASADSAPSDGPPAADPGSSDTSAPSAPDNAPAGDSGASDDGPTAPSPDAGGDPAAEQGPMSAEALEAEYAALPPEELQMHLMAVTSAYQKLAAGGSDPSADPSAPPAPDAPPPAGDASAGGPPPPPEAMKSQSKDVLDRLTKAEAAISSVPLLVQQLQASQAENALLRKAASKFDEAAGAVTSFLETATGRRKAVTGSTATQMVKSESTTKDVSTMSKSELNKYFVELRKSTPTLKKSECEAILKFVSNGEADIEPIRHLVK